MLSRSEVKDELIFGAKAQTFGWQKLTLIGLVDPLNPMWVFCRAIKKLEFGMTKSFNFFDETQNRTKKLSKLYV